MKKKYLGLICLLYAGIILFVNHYNILRNFLAPNMHIYIKSSAFILIIIGLIILYSESFHYKFKFTDLVLILPLIMLIYAGDGRISTSLALNRNSNITSIKSDTVSNEKEEEIIIDESKLDFDNVDFDVDDETYLDLANYLTTNKKAQKYIGKTIRVRGFTIEDNSYLPNGYYGIGKYGVSCCVADAGYMGFIMKANGHKIKGSTWYEVEGYLEKSKDLAGHDFLGITIVNLKEIDEKDEEEYVYPCYQYGDGSCSKIRNYSLEY